MHSAEENAMMAQMVLTSAAYVANGGIGLVVIGGVLYKAVGWRVRLFWEKEGYCIVGYGSKVTISESVTIS